MQFLQKTVHMVFFSFFLNITEPSFDIASLTVDNLSKSTEGENQIALIDKGKKENDLVAVLVLARPSPRASQ